MTLLTNEIRLIDGFTETLIISTADRRLTYPKENNRKKKYESGKKLFKIEHLNATVSYWGNCVLINEKGNQEFYFSWLPNFIRKSYHIDNLMEFARKLKAELNIRVPAQTLREYASGFHLAGYTKKGEPEFIHFSNCNWNSSKVIYENILYAYKEPYADFLEEHAKQFGWDGHNASSVKAKNESMTYRNGDIKIHEAAWGKLDEVFRTVFSFSDFKTISTKKTDDLEQLVRLKLKFIGDIYNRYAYTNWVGGPFDVIILKRR
ncbi:MAG: hypothetical protein ACK5YS_03700 [bacterium]|jgi:hypothetical protein